MKYIRSKPLIEDITHQKPAIIYQRFKPSRLLKLTPELRISNAYQDKLNRSLYSDVLLTPVRADKKTRWKVPNFFLLKFKATIVKSAESAKIKDSAVDVITTDPSLTRVVVRPELNNSFKKFESSYLIFRKSMLNMFLTSPKLIKACIPTLLLTLRTKAVSSRKIEFECGEEVLEKAMMENLNSLISQGIDTSSTEDNIIHIVLSNTALQDQLNGQTLDFTQVDDKFKENLRQKWPSLDVISLQYNDSNKLFIQFVYKIINYYL